MKHTNPNKKYVLVSPSTWVESSINVPDEEVIKAWTKRYHRIDHSRKEHTWLKEYAGLPKLF